MEAQIMEALLNALIAQTTSIEIRAAVAQDAFNAERARRERLFCKAKGWKAPLKASQYWTMNGVVDLEMTRSMEGEELTVAMRAVREHKAMIAEIRAGYPF